MRSLASLVVLGGALLAGLAGCSTPTSGQAVPGDPAETTGTGRPSATAGTRPTSGNPQAGNSPMAGIDPCTLLDAAAKAKLGISGDEGEHRELGIARNCRWRLRGPDRTYVLDVGIIDSAGITDIPSNRPVEKLPNIGDHQAVRGKEAGGQGTCAIILGVTESSRVDANVGASGDTQKACELVMELAKQVEPKLP